MENQLVAESIMKAVTKEFDGRNPLNELREQLDIMEKDELIKIALISANKLGTLLKGTDYTDALDAMVHLNYGADLLLRAYGLAEMGSGPQTVN